MMKDLPAPGPGVRRRLFEILDDTQPGGRANAVVGWSLTVLIGLNMAAIVLESTRGLPLAVQAMLKAFEVFSIIVFSCEFLARLAVADHKLERRPLIRAAALYLITPMALVDLASILPYYIPLVLPLDLRFLRALRLLRVLRLLKAHRYSRSLQLIAKVLRDKKEELVATVFVTGLLIFVAAALMYNLEGGVQPDKFPDMIATLWWAISTLTTIGYGDVYPVTAWGRFLSGVIAVLGIGMVALPAGVLSSGFIHELSTRRAHRTCPHCGKPLDG
jgi:voltage-gated potassium channel